MIRTTESRDRDVLSGGILAPLKSMDDFSRFRISAMMFSAMDGWADEHLTPHSKTVTAGFSGHSSPPPSLTFFF